jgi:DNA polymerase III alpha subunit
MALIATDMMLRLKTSILDAERAQNGFVSIETSMMCRSFKGAAQGQSDKDWLFGYKDKSTGEHVKGFWEDQKNPSAALLRAWAEKNPRMWDTVLKCIGICKTRGVHAGGIVLSPDEIQKYVPLIQTKQGFATAYSMKPIETIGLVKYDFLGVKTLKAQGISIKSINEHHLDTKIEWGEFPHDPRVYSEIISKDRLAGIFQMSGGAVRSVATQINPKSIIDIALWISLMRPGAMDAPSPDPSDTSDITAAMYYIKCAQGLRKPYYIHPDLENILGETYGVIVTQEQALKLFRVLAGYTYETAEDVRRAIGKKIEDLLAVHSAVLKKACIERGYRRICAILLQHVSRSRLCHHRLQRLLDEAQLPGPLLERRAYCPYGRPR